MEPILRIIKEDIPENIHVLDQVFIGSNDFKEFSMKILTSARLFTDPTVDKETKSKLKNAIFQHTLSALQDVNETKISTLKDFITAGTKTDKILACATMEKIYQSNLVIFQQQLIHFRTEGELELVKIKELEIENTKHCINTCKLMLDKSPGAVKKLGLLQVKIQENEQKLQELRSKLNSEEEED
jgi:hypothetical protein